MYEIFEKILELKGLRPVDVANGTGIRKSSFTEWKNGKSKPNTEKMIKIANFLDVSVEYLVTGKDTTNINYENDEEYLLFKEIIKRQPMKELYKKIEKFDDDTILSIAAMIENINR